MKFNFNLYTIVLFASLKIFAQDITPDTITVNYLRNEFYAAIEDEDKTYLLEDFIKIRLPFLRVAQYSGHMI